MELQDIFLEALECATPELRQRFLETACDGRPELRAEVEAMLMQAPHLDTYLERSVFTTPAAQEALVPSQAEVQTHLGSRFRLISCLGEGGMGSVWLAHQTHPIERQVAIKLLKPGFDSQRILARFETERNTLAQLQHPNIATIFDAGTAEDGRPFFVMEYCGGPTIAEYASSARLGLRDRLELFIPVCRAIDYVHQLDILHRDIKPSNVLVAEYNGLAVPKVIDFGIAKSVGQELPRGTKHSAPWGLTGTPEYMAPELITGQPAAATKLSDIYSLGAMLYELLVGTPPYGAMRSDQSGLLEYMKRVDETDPVPPSRAIRRRGAMANVDGSNGQADASDDQHPTPVAGEPPSELDWVVMKALERDPNRRYPDVAALQADVRAFLDGQAVTAQPPSLVRRAARWWRRNRIPAATAALSLAALLLLAANFWNGPSRESGAGNLRDPAASDAAVASATNRADRLEQAFIDDLRGAVRDTIQRLSRADRSQQEVERQTLRDLASRWASLAESVGTDQRRAAVLAESNFRLGQIHGSLGEPDLAIERLLAAESIYQGLADEMIASPMQAVYRVQNLTELGRQRFEKGSPTDALNSFAQAIELGNALSVDGEAKKESLQALAASHTDRGKVLLRSGKAQDALASIDQAMTYLRDLEGIDPNDDRTQQLILSTLIGRGFILRSLGQIEAALADMRSGQDRIAIIAKTSSDRELVERLRGSQHLNLGLAFFALRRHAEAEVELAQARTIFEALVKGYPSNHEHRERLASTVNSLGANAFLAGDVDQGVADCEYSASIWRRLAQEFPSLSEYGKSEAEVEMNLAVMASRATRFEKAEASARRGMETSQRLAKSFPERVDFAIVAARSHAILAGIQSQRGESDLAITTLDEAIRLFEQIASRFPDSVESRDGLATALATRADLWSKKEDHRKALHDYAAAAALVELLPRQAAGVTQPRHLTDLQGSCAQMHIALHEPQAAVVWLERIEATLRQRLVASPDDESLKENLRQVETLKAEISVDAP
jgi:serine/threonine protein kinase/tetratricopeptide (TPR) repeat protein